MIYMLDTNIISYIIKNNNIKLIDKFEDISKQSDILLSSIVVAELLFGIRKKGSAKLEQKVKEFISPFKIVDFDENCANKYAIIRTTLEKSGNLIGSNDMLIASHALALNATLITNNTREFDKVDGLIVEDWSQ